MNNGLLRNFVLTAALICSVCLFTGCSNVQGTYTDSSNTYTLVVKSGGEATLTAMGNSGQCTYTVNGEKLELTCPGQAGAIEFTIHDDGSLTPPPGTESALPVFKKAK